MTPLRRQLQSMLRVEPRDGGFTATFTLEPTLSILPDHFKGAPILPGVCMVQLVLLSAAQTLNLPNLHLRHLKNAKILRPILPNDQVRIEGMITHNPDESLTIKATFTTESAQRCAEFSLMTAPHVGADPRVRPGLSEDQGRTRGSAPTTNAHLPPLPPGEASGIGDGPRAGRGEGELRATPNTLPSPGTRGDASGTGDCPRAGREGIPLNTFPVTRASSPCRTMPLVNPSTIRSPESGAA